MFTNNRIDQKIRSILKDLDRAQKRCEEFSGRELKLGEKIVPRNIFEMGLVYDNRNRIEMDLELAQTEKYPEVYTKEQVEFLRKERDRYQKRVRAWQNRQFPSQFRE